MNYIQYNPFNITRSVVTMNKTSNFSTMCRFFDEEGQRIICVFLPSVEQFSILGL